MIEIIPRDIIHRTARETGVDVKDRTYSVLSHLGTMLFAQLAHALSLNDVCDWLRLKARAIAALGLTPPSRNNLSNSNKVRDARFAELVFWRTLAHLQHHDHSFGRQRPGGNAGRALLHRFKVRIHAVDSTVMELVANCMNWAKHRRRKAAAKMHLRLGLNSFLPTFAIVDNAGEHDNKRAREVCAGLEEGEVVVFDKAYVDFEHLHYLDLRGVQWVTRAKDNFRYRALRKLPVNKGYKFKHLKGWTLRRVEAWGDGELRLMLCISNNTAWSAGSMCDRFRATSRRSTLRGSLRPAFSLRSAQTDEADAQARRLPGSQRQRHPLASVDRAAAALCGAHRPMGAPLYATLRRGARGDVGTA